MGDSGEGLVDAEARIQERMEEMELERGRAKGPKLKKNAQLEREIESLKMARRPLEQQLKATTNSARKAQLMKALEDLEKRIAGLSDRR